MAIHLITGKPGSYKSASVMEFALKAMDSGRMVYFCNFRNLKAEQYGLTTMDHFKEWVNVPDGSLIIIDEVQEFTRDVPTNVKTEDLPDWMTLLEKHRHRGIDIYVVTQHPMFIHTHIRRLLEKHVHMQRVQGMPWSNRREWQQVCNEPENLLNCTIKAGCTTTVYRPSKKVFNYYESTTEDTHKFKIPPKLIKSVLILGSVACFAVYMGLPVAQKYLNLSDKEITDNAVQIDANDTRPQHVILEEHKAKSMGLTVEQYRDLQNPSVRDSELLATNHNDLESIAVQYSPSKPYQTYDLTYEITAKPVFSGCVKFDGRYIAYTQQGTKLEVSASDCRRLIEDGDRPFNYFKTEQQLQVNQQLAPQQLAVQQTQQLSSEDLAKFQQAKESGLI